METQTPYLTPSLSDSHQQPPLVWELIRWLQAVAHQWQTITRAPTEWVIPREIGIAIPHGWATESSPPAPEPGLCPPTTTICTSRFPANQEHRTTTTTLATAPLGGILTSTDSTATSPHVTGKDSSTTTGDSDPRDSTSSSLTFKSRRSRRMTVRRRLPITLPARFRCLLTRSTSSRTSSARRIKDASRRSQQTSSWCHSMDTSP
uniref:Assembly activating protein AAP n=1 Tax=Adeno-associated virus TaxID=272636 RepID=A0A513ZV30_9VIRU|nr:assembly activating protein AAP [Adeno-associated virus]